jgi:NAD(P)-dependent dehydrogenase (short-subunit alcohol dehydrogenase family)
MSFDLQLNGLRAVVTGGTLGLGAAVVKTLLQAGARVATSARTLPAQPLEGVTYVAADLSIATGVNHFAQTILQTWGGADILINVLGGSKTPGGWFCCDQR